ncbi:MAG: ribosomal RNA small subunit methyltransferase A [Planctomycetes bacterium]|nr:ribosomal RNA small subunit methyltransferase A [Planctomycetota bacterium]
MNHLAQDLLDAGFRPNRRLGQNFLFDQNFLDLMVREAALGPDDVALEFGTGPGQLTERLAARAAFVHTIEIEPRLHEFARGRLVLPNVHFHLGDAIPGGDRLNPELCEAVGKRLGGRRLRVVSNFPYSVGGSILLALAEGQLPAFDAVGTLQKEVAERLAAGPGDEAYGPLGILLRRLARVEVLRDVARQLFWPVPRVDSALVRVTFGAARFEGDWKGYRQFVKLAFSQRRKTLTAGLRKLGLAYSGVHARCRPEDLSPEELEDVWREGTRAR